MLGLNNYFIKFDSQTNMDYADNNQSYQRGMQD